MIARFLKLLAFVPPVLLGLMFLLQGASALINPDTAARAWGFDLPDGGFALSSMVGIIASHGLALSLCLFIGVIRRERVWYYPPMLMFFFLGLGRFVAGTVHGAAFMPERFIPEFVFVGLLYLSSIYATKNTSKVKA
ncbi:MAG: hypothetical protein AAFQ90_04765 [Pseudomonadota bacterium]